MRINSLDGLRGTAAYMVVVCHLPPQEAIFWGLLKQFGQLGVMIFFVLSGFLMGTLYMRQPITKEGIWEFYARRIARVVPLYYVVIFASFALYLLTGSVWPLYYVTSDTLIQHAFFISGLNVLWTIPVEIQFYALFPLIWWFFSRAGTAALAWLVVVCAAISWSAGIADVPMLVSRGSYFLAGVLISTMTLPSSRYTDALFAALLLALPLLLPDVRAAIGLPRGALWSSPYYLPLISLLVLSAAHSPLAQSVLGGRPGRFAGDISYSVYLLHMPLHFVVVAAMGGTKDLWTYGLTFALVTPVAWLSYRLIEVPARRAVSARLLRPETSTATTADVTGPALVPLSRPI